MIRSNKGFMFLNVTTIGLLLALVAAWYMHRAYVSGSFNSDIAAMVSDGKKTMDIGQTSTGDQPYDMPKVRAAVSAIISKYSTLPAGVTKAISPTTASPAPAQGVYYGQQ